MVLRRCTEISGLIDITSYYRTRGISVLLELYTKSLTILIFVNGSDSIIFFDSILCDGSRRLGFVNWYLYGAKTTRDRAILSDARGLLGFTLTHVMEKSRIQGMK